MTPPTNNRQFLAGTGTGSFPIKFSSSPVSPTGDGYLWTLFASGAPGGPSTGSQNLLEAQRTSEGWSYKFLSPTPQQAEISSPGSADSTHQYITFEVENGRGGSLGGCACLLSSWVRYPNGEFRPLGEGTVPTGTDTDGYDNGFVDDPFASAFWISPGGTHQIFESNVALVSSVADGPNQVYDRTPSGLHLVSTLPGEIPPTGDSLFAGSSMDGSTVLFSNENNLYARIDNLASVLIASGADGAFIPGGVNFDGSRAFFVQNGDIFYYDTEAEEVKEVIAAGDASPAYVSPDGSHVYFLSAEELIAGKGTLGSPNLYVWDGASVKFIGTVTSEDVSHSENEGFQPFAGLGLWAEVEPNPVAQNKNFLTDTARTTFDGSVFVFESRASLTGYPTEGHAEIYRYETASEQLDCVSCSPVEPAAGSDSNLVFLRSEGEGILKSVYPMHEIANLSADGARVVFESKDSLLPEDTNGVRDVYQWSSKGLSLISTGHAAFPSGVVGVSATGDDIFFQTAERLVTQGQDLGTYAIYDARVNGGLSSQQASPSLECQGEGCLQMPAAPPTLSVPGSSQLHGKGNVKKRCHARRHNHHRKKGRDRPRHGKKKCASKVRRASK